MPDRNALADALMSATPEQLREDAAFAEQAARFVGGQSGRESMLRLAALALAVAEMQERAVEVHSDGAATLYFRRGSTEYKSLPAALAALVREGA